jgi:hypothetical protein
MDSIQFPSGAGPARLAICPSVKTTKFGDSMIGKMRDIVDARLRLLTSAVDFLARDDKTVRAGLSPFRRTG